MGSSNTHIKSCRDKVDSITNYSHTAGSAVKTPPANAGDPGSSSRVVKIPWTRKWQPAPVFMPGKSRGHRSLVGYGPRGCKRIRHKLVTNNKIREVFPPSFPLSGHCWIWFKNWRFGVVIENQKYILLFQLKDESVNPVHECLKSQNFIKLWWLQWDSQGWEIEAQPSLPSKTAARRRCALSLLSWPLFCLSPACRARKLKKLLGFGGSDTQWQTFSSTPQRKQFFFKL